MDLVGKLSTDNAVRPALQARSQETVARILDSGEDLLRKKGLAAFTMANVAARAGRGVGTIYERFADRDSLLFALFERYLERGAQTNSRNLSKLGSSGADLAALCSAIAVGLVRRNRRDARILQALRAHAAATSSEALSKHALSVAGKALSLSREALLRRRSEIKRADARAAVDAVLLMLGGAAELNGSAIASKREDDDLAQRLAEAALCYLTSKDNRTVNGARE